ncbi:hypothetical protein AAG906_020044 [Vitis piasezkii]
MYGQVIQGSEPSAHNDGRPYEVGSSHSDDPTEFIEARLSRNLEHLMSLASSVAQDIATLRAMSSGGQSGCALTPPEEDVNVERKKDKGNTDVHPCSDEMIGKGTGAASTHSGQQRVSGAAVDDGACVQEDCGSKQVTPTPRQRFKHTAKRLVKLATICKSPFVSQCVQLFPKINQQERLVADYALSEDSEPSEILCNMHGTYITWDELSSLNGGHWVNSAVCVKDFVVYQMMNAKQARPPRAHYFNSSFSMRPKSMKSESNVECSFMMNLWAMISQVVIWYVKSSTMVSWPKPLFHLIIILYATKTLEIGLFEFLPNQPMILVCVVQDKMHLYRLRLVITLVTNAANNARDKVLKACRI